MECPKCKRENPDDARYCNGCGAPFTTDKQSRPTILTTEAERKRVTALFSDLSGYTAMASKLDPEEVKNIMNTIFDGMKKTILKYGGFIEHSAGDSVLALFGIPKAHEDDAVRAIYAAQEIHAFVDSLSPGFKEKTGITLSMHSGINTGLAVTADVNQIKGTHKVTGDVINVAARLSGLAEAHEIIVGPETYKACNNTFAFDVLSPVKVKGKTKPIVLHRVSTSKLSADNNSMDRQVFSAMVGRDKELDKLEIQVLKVINGEGSVVNVSGEAGIGKSRLIAELKKRDVIKRVTVLEGRSISIGKNLSFHPIIDLLKQWAEISEESSPTEAFDKLKLAIQTVHPEESNEILPFIATLMGMNLIGKYAQRVEGIESEGLEKLIVKNIRELLIKGSEIGPMVLIMEDLHWADESSIELLEILYGLAENYRLLFINVFRPGYLEDKHKNITTIGERLPVYYIGIEIQPLMENDSQKLINNILDIKGIPYAIREQIMIRAGGNPFFIEEVVRSLIDEGIIVTTDAGFSVSEKINSVVIPPTINDILIARIDRLEKRTRELLKVAAVIGRSFFDRILKDVADSIDDLDGKLAYLKDAQLIRDRVRMQEIEYLFNHALAREAAYESTLIQQRKALHFKVAQSIEKIFHKRLPEFYGTIAHHYSMAEDEEKAEEYLVKAGEEALKSSASMEAMHYYQEAMALYIKKYGKNVDKERMMKFERNIAFALLTKGYHAEAVEHFNKTLTYLGKKELSSETFNSILLFINIIMIIIYLYLPTLKSKKTPTPKDSLVFDIIQQRAKAYTSTDSRKFFAGTIYALRKSFKFDISKSTTLNQLVSSSSAYFSWTGISFNISRKLLEYTEKQLGMGKKDSFNIYYLISKMSYNIVSGNWEDKLDETIVEECLKKGDTFEASHYLIFLRIQYENSGNFETSKNIISKLYSISEEYNDLSTKVMACHAKGFLLAKQNLKYEALKFIDECILLSEKIGQRDRIISALGTKSRLQTLLNKTQAAKISLEKAKSLKAEGIVVAPYYLGEYFFGHFLYNVTKIEKSSLPWNDIANLKHIKAAEKYGKKLIKLVKKDATKRTSAYSYIGKYYWLIKKPKKAVEWWSKAIKEGGKLGARPDLSRTYFEVGKHLLEPDSKYKKLNGIDAEGYLEKAEILFKEMNLVKDLDDLERVRTDYDIQGH
jgi:class 3 adenylate cyclase/tetratricopeptide (TPR) repeat protein